MVPGDGLLAVLDGYFEAEPYTPWFAWFEGVLRGMDASYYSAVASNTALHTDICSPLATGPTWSKLPESARVSLQKAGRPLWHDLVRALRPHVLVVSVAARHLDAIEFPRLADPVAIYRLERARPHVATVQPLDVDGHRCLLAFGKAALTPFQLIDAAARLEVGTRIGAAL